MGGGDQAPLRAGAGPSCSLTVSTSGGRPWEADEASRGIAAFWGREQQRAARGAVHERQRRASPDEVPSGGEAERREASAPPEAAGKGR